MRLLTHRPLHAGTGLVLAEGSTSSCCARRTIHTLQLFSDAEVDASLGCPRDGHDALLDLPAFGQYGMSTRTPPACPGTDGGYRSVAAEDAEEFVLCTAPPLPLPPPRPHCTSSARPRCELRDGVRNCSWFTRPYEAVETEVGAALESNATDVDATADVATQERSSGLPYDNGAAVGQAATASQRCGPPSLQRRQRQLHPLPSIMLKAHPVDGAAQQFSTCSSSSRTVASCNVEGEGDAECACLSAAAAPPLSPFLSYNMMAHHSSSHAAGTLWGVTSAMEGRGDVETAALAQQRPLYPIGEGKDFTTAPCCSSAPPPRLSSLSEPSRGMWCCENRHRRDHRTAQAARVVPLHHDGGGGDDDDSSDELQLYDSSDADASTASEGGSPIDESDAIMRDGTRGLRNGPSRDRRRRWVHPVSSKCSRALPPPSVNRRVVLADAEHPHQRGRHLLPHPHLSCVPHRYRRDARSMVMGSHVFDAPLPTTDIAALLQCASPAPALLSWKADRSCGVTAETTALAIVARYYEAHQQNA